MPNDRRPRSSRVGGAGEPRAGLSSTPSEPAEGSTTSLRRVRAESANVLIFVIEICRTDIVSTVGGVVKALHGDEV